MASLAFQFSKVRNSTKHKINGLLTVPRISSTIFQEVRMAAFVHSLGGLTHFIMETTSMSTNVGKQKGPPDQKSNLETCLALSIEALQS